jgi:hypothetical protein
MLIALYCLAHASGVRAEGRDWTARHTMQEAAVATLTLVDTMQTIRFVQQGREELNPLLGRRPNVTKLLAYDVLALGLHAGVAYALREPYRSTWQYVWIGAEVWQIGCNVRTHAALQVAWPWDW